MINDKVYDILIIGGGINGCGIALDAAGRGLKVALVEKGDLGSETSSWSSKLIHGGLRYLEQYDFKLVSESLKERKILQSLAPHLVQPIPFIFPYIKSLRPYWLIRIGLFLYDYLALNQLVPKSKAIKNLNELGLKDNFNKGFKYYDCQVDDSRLVLSVGLSAIKLGADFFTNTLFNNAQIINNEKAKIWQANVLCNGIEKTIYAKCIINASGNFVTETSNNKLNLKSKYNIKHVKGSHIVVPKLFKHNNAFTLQNDDGRVIFVIPYLNKYTLIGTTDVEISNYSSKIKISNEEISYLLKAVNKYFNINLKNESIIWTFAGSRALFDDGSKNVSKVTRDYSFEIFDSPNNPLCINIFGGKLTTYRHLAETLVSKLKKYFPNLEKPFSKNFTLYGGDIENKDLNKLITELSKQKRFCSLDLITRLGKAYGSNCFEILKNINSINDLGICFGSNLYQVEVDYLIYNELATTIDDIIWRRTKMGLELSNEQIENLENYIKTCIKN